MFTFVSLAFENMSRKNCCCWSQSGCCLCSPLGFSWILFSHLHLSSIFHRAGTNNPNISKEPQINPNSQREVENENQSQSHLNSGLQGVVESCDHQHSVAQKETHLSMEQNGKSRN